MHLLDRYLQAVGVHLPAGRRADILAELRANLLAEIEDREGGLDRPLNDDEIAEILRHHGNPLHVAVRYLPQRHLIGPMVFPWYLQTLRITAPLLVIIYTLVQAATFVFGSRTGAGQIGSSILGLFSAALLSWGLITLGYACFEFFFSRNPKLAKLQSSWDPRRLPDTLTVIRSRTSSRSTTQLVGDLAMQVIVSLWLLAVPYRPFLLLGPGLFALQARSIVLNPDLAMVYGAVLLLSVLQIPLKLLALLRRSWQAWCGILSLALGVAMLGLLARVPAFLVYQGSSAIDATLVGRINPGLHIAFIAALVTMALLLVLKLYRQVVDGVIASDEAIQL